MSSVKKAFQPLIAFLQEAADAGKKVSSILEDAVAMCAPKQGGGGLASNVKKDDDGNVTHVMCYYHKMWEPVVGDEAVEYGSKANSASGLNSMCKEGTSQWTKQQRVAKKANEGLLVQVTEGTLLPEGIAGAQVEIEAARGAIVPREDGIGYDDV
ncbi:MAG: hypothetical protein V3S69_02650 [Dehalococcoidales bacterium]